MFGQQVAALRVCGSDDVTDYNTLVGTIASATGCHPWPQWAIPPISIMFARSKPHRKHSDTPSKTQYILHLRAILPSPQGYNPSDVA